MHEIFTKFLGSTAARSLRLGDSAIKDGQAPG